MQSDVIAEREREFLLPTSDEQIARVLRELNPNMWQETADELLSNVHRQCEEDPYYVEAIPHKNGPNLMNGYLVTDIHLRDNQ